MLLWSGASSGAACEKPAVCVAVFRGQPALICWHLGLASAIAKLLVVDGCAHTTRVPREHGIEAHAWRLGRCAALLARFSNMPKPCPLAQTIHLKTFKTRMRQGGRVRVCQRGLAVAGGGRPGGSRPGLGLPALQSWG